MRTNGVNTNGAAAKAMNFDGFGKKIRPATFGKIKAGQREKNNEFGVTPLVLLTPFVPLRALLFGSCFTFAGDAAGAYDKRELEYRTPRLHPPVNSRRFPEIFGDFCKNRTSFL